VTLFVTPVKTGVQKHLNSLDTCIRRYDGIGNLKWFCKRLADKSIIRYCPPTTPTFFRHMQNMLREPRKSLGTRREGRKSRNEEPERGECVTDHLSVIGDGGWEEKRHILLSSGDGKELSGREAKCERQVCRHVLLTKD